MGAKFFNTFFFFLNLVLKQLVYVLYFPDVSLEGKSRTLGV